MRLDVQYCYWGNNWKTEGHEAEVGMEALDWDADLAPVKGKGEGRMIR